MTIEWNIASTEGFDVEEVDAPRSVTDTCPSCDRRVRLVEHELVKNLKVFDLPLLAVERGARVFRCPNCEVCFEPPGEVATGGAVGAVTIDLPDEEIRQRVAALAQKLTRANDELELWRMRVELATRRDEPELAAEARTLVDRYETLVTTLRREMASLAEDATAAPTPREERAESVAVGATPVIKMPVPPAPPERKPDPTPAEVEDEMAALKRKLKGKG